MAESRFGSGITRALARYRAERVADLRYRLDCRIDARATRLACKQEVRFRLHGGAGDLALDWRPQTAAHATARSLRSLSVNGLRPTAATLRGGRLWIPASALSAGHNTIALSWSAPIRSSGGALTRYCDARDGALYVYSLFVPADASTVFPCFDQPDLKARFELTLELPERWSAIGNAPVAQTRRERGRRRIVFAATEPISTYTFAFAAGPFVALGPAAGDDATRLWVRRSQRRRARPRAHAILDLNRTALRYCARYFAHPFPFRKYDLVLVPHFAYRGMEHAGATFLNEDAILLPRAASAQERMQRAQLLFHETAHQWIGDLVTMRWFDDLWIKEGFANFMASKLAEHACSRRLAAAAFHDLKMGAYEADRTRGATALHNPVADLVRAKAAYNTIVYAKAPVVLRMLERALGRAAFRAGVRAIVRAHAYGACDWRDLRAAFERASGRRLHRWARAWLLRKGAGATRAPERGMHAHEYALMAPDAAGVARALAALARSRATLRRRHLWEYLWAAVRNRTLDPLRFLETVLSQGANEASAPGIARLATRYRAVIDRVLEAAERLQWAHRFEALACHAMRTSPDADMRRAWTRALIGCARTPAGLARLSALLENRHCRLGSAERLAAAAALVAAGRLTVRRAAGALRLPARSATRRLAVHCLEAARPSARRKRALLRRWLDDPDVPEHWIEAALPHFNHPAHAGLTAELLSDALAALPVLLVRRKIFFVNRWVAAFIGGQRGAAALKVVRRYAERKALATELRLMVLEAADMLVWCSGERMPINARRGTFRSARTARRRAG